MLAGHPGHLGCPSAARPGLRRHGHEDQGGEAHGDAQEYEQCFTGIHGLQPTGRLIPVPSPVAHGMQQGPQEFRLSYDILDQDRSAGGVGHGNPPVRVFLIGSRLVLRATVAHDVR